MAGCPRLEISVLSRWRTTLGTAQLNRSASVRVCGALRSDHGGKSLHSLSKTIDAIIGGRHGGGCHGRRRRSTTAVPSLLFFPATAGWPATLAPVVTGAVGRVIIAVTPTVRLVACPTVRPARLVAVVPATGTVRSWLAVSATRPCSGGFSSVATVVATSAPRLPACTLSGTPALNRQSANCRTCHVGEQVYTVSAMTAFTVTTWLRGFRTRTLLW